MSEIVGVQCTSLRPVGDQRGAMVELFRQAWMPGFAPVQWNVSDSAGNVLRGLHCHTRHTDLLYLLSGVMRLGLRDLRVGSPTEGLAETIDLEPLSQAVLIPPGVAHGFYFPGPAQILFAMSHEWDPDDDLACRWDDPAIGIEWGCTDPVLSERDRVSGTLAEMAAVVAARIR